MQPLRIAKNDFEGFRVNMKGFGELKKTYTPAQLNLLATGNGLRDFLIDRIQRSFMMHLVTDSASNEILFAGSVKKGFTEERALLTIYILE